MSDRSLAPRRLAQSRGQRESIEQPESPVSEICSPTSTSPTNQHKISIDQKLPSADRPVVRYFIEGRAMNCVLNAAALRSVALPAFANRGGNCADVSPDEDADRLEGGPGLFRCILLCSLVSLTGFSVAAWLIV
jgi:hypothetical protein